MATPLRMPADGSSTPSLMFSNAPNSSSSPMIGTPNHSVQYGHQFKRRKLSDGHDTPSSAPPIEPLKWDPASFQGTLFQNDQGQVFRPPFSAPLYNSFAYANAYGQPHSQAMAHPPVMPQRPASAQQPTFHQHPMQRVELPAASSSPMLHHHQQGQQARVVSPMPNFRLRAPFTAPQDRVPFATSSSPSLRAPQPISTSPEQAGHTSDVNFSSPSPQGDKSTDDDSWVPHQPSTRVFPRAAKQVEQLSSEDKFTATDMARSASAPSATASYAKPQRAAVTAKQTRKKASNKVESAADAEGHRSSAAPVVSLGRPQARSEAKPDLSYAALIGRAILNSDSRKLSLNDIYLYIMQTWPYYKKDHAGWQNSIRHNLSLNDSFDKIARGPDNPGKGMLWTIVEGCEHRFAGGGYSKLPKKQGSSSPPPQESESPAAEPSQASDHGPFLPPVHIEPSGPSAASAPTPPAEVANKQPVPDRDPTPQPPSLAPGQMREATPPSTSPLPDGKAFPTEAERPSGSQSPKSPHQRWSMSPLSMAQKGKLKAIDDYSSPSEEEEAEELPPPASPAKKPQTPAGPSGHRRTISATRCVTPYRLGTGLNKRSNGPDLLESSRALANLQDTPPPAAARYSPGQIHQTPKYIWELGDACSNTLEWNITWGADNATGTPDRATTASMHNTPFWHRS